MDPLREAERLFLDNCPGYQDTTVLDDLRRSHYEQIDRLGHVYLDYTGGGLYASTQIREHMDLLLASVLGNPHSSNPTSALATLFVERARQAVHQFFNASSEEYVVVFTQNATGALKLVGDQYLARVYRLASQRFHLERWDAGILRKLETLNSIYGKMSDQAATRRMEVLEWIIIILIAVSIAVMFVPGTAGH